MGLLLGTTKDSSSVCLRLQGRQVKQPKLREMDKTLGIALATSGESEDPVADGNHLESSTLLRFLLSHRLAL